MPDKIKILVVDGQMSAQTTLSDLLIREGYEVEVAESVENASNLLKLNKRQFDLVITELLGFPDMRGFDLIKRIKNLDSTILPELRFHRPGSDKPVAVIILTAYGDLKNPIESKKCGADDFVSKPYDDLELLITIERVLSD